MFSLATGEVLAQYDQDFVLGLYWLSRDESGLKDKLLERFFLMVAAANWSLKRMLGKSEGNSFYSNILPRHIPKKHPRLSGNWSNLAFDCCSRLGVSSSGFMKWQSSQIAARKRHKKSLAHFDKTKPGAINNELRKRPSKNLSGKFWMDEQISTKLAYTFRQWPCPVLVGEAKSGRF